MATANERNEIAKLNTRTAVMERDIKYLVKNVDDLQRLVSSLSFVSQATYDKDMALVNDRLKELEDYNDTNRIGTVFASLLGNRAMTLVVTLLIAAALYIAVKGEMQP